MNTLLTIKNLHASVGEKEILRGIDLAVKPGEVHAIMGPNGSGKSTLSAVLAGRDTFTVTQGSVTYDGRDLLTMAPEERAWAGIFLGFQYPVEIPGVSNANFMKAAIQEQRKQRGLEPLSAAQFLKLMREKIKTRPISFQLLPPLFTLTQLQRLYEAVIGEEVDKRNFRKRIKEMDYIEKTELIDKTHSKRGAALYRFNKKAYDEDPNFKL